MVFGLALIFSPLLETGDHTKGGFVLKENSMYFVTDEPKLFNAETGTLIYALHQYVYLHSPGVRDDDEKVLFNGTEKECEDFIYSIAGYVGAVNPMGKYAKNDKELVNFVKAARDIIDSGPMVSIDNELADDMVETANRILDGIA